jgi:hypothetical protein
MHHGVSFLLLGLTIFALFVFVVFIVFIIRAVLPKKQNESEAPIAEEKVETESPCAKATEDKPLGVKAADGELKDEDDAISAEGINSFMEVAALENETEAAGLREQAAKLEKSAADLRLSAIPAKKQISRHEQTELGLLLKQEQLRTQLLQEGIRRAKIARMAETEAEISILDRKIAAAKLALKK